MSRFINFNCRSWTQVSKGFRCQVSGKSRCQDCEPDDVKNYQIPQAGYICLIGLIGLIRSIGSV